jgi:hypothetical protein
MGFDCGFDIYPALEPTPSNQEKYEHFIQEVMQTYSLDDANPDSYLDSAERPAKLVSKPHGAILEFKVGEYPFMPYNAHLCNYFLRFSSKVSSTSTELAEPFLEGVYKIAKRRFGSRVKWWHEMDEWGTKVQMYGFYDWTEIHRVRKELEIVLNGDLVDDGDNGLKEKKEEKNVSTESVGDGSASKDSQGPNKM